ncbi:MAG: helix-turn-helix transcriptional regulator [Myxococcota bacterium]
MNNVTLGRVIAERRAALGLSLKELGSLVHKEDGHGVSAQYLHDIGRDRRTPSPHVRGELARALGVDVHYLAAVAGQCPPEVTTYLRERPDCGPAVAAFFARARATGFDDWNSVETGSKRAVAR